MTINERRQEKALETLLVEPDLRKAAKRAGVGESTLYRWLKEPAFSDRYKELRKQAFDTVLHRLQASASEAVETLRSISADEEAPASSRVSAAKTILEMAVAAREHEEFDCRLKALEEKMNAGGLTA